MPCDFFKPEIQLSMLSIWKEILLLNKKTVENDKKNDIVVWWLCSVQMKAISVDIEGGTFLISDILHAAKHESMCF